MQLQVFLPWIIFAAFTIGAWAIISLFGKEESRATERLDELRDPSLRDRGKSKGKNSMTLLERAAPALSKALQPKSELESNLLRVRLATAGYNSANAPQMYLALKMLFLVVGLFLGGGAGMLTYGPTKNGYLTIACVAGFMFYLPEMAVAFLSSSRKQKIFLSMPDCLDLLVVCVEAGLGLDAGMRRITEELNDTAPELCSELSLANMQLQMGRVRRDVLHDLGVRTGCDDMKALVATLIQSERFGSSIARALRVQSEAMRVKRRQMAEEKAQKTAVQMLFPMVLFIFPGIFVVLVGPAAIKMGNM
jgi:tight adherence protein C